MYYQEVGECSVCRRDSVIMRKYYYYDVKCDCCNGDSHFVIVRHCGDCAPKAPTKIQIILNVNAIEGK